MLKALSAVSAVTHSHFASQQVNLSPEALAILHDDQRRPPSIQVTEDGRFRVPVPYGETVRYYTCEVSQEGRVESAFLFGGSSRKTVEIARQALEGILQPRS
jgi:hypothetical protein